MPIVTFLCSCCARIDLRPLELVLTLLLFTVTTLGHASPHDNATHPIINLTALQARLAQAQSDVVLVDVRESNIYQKGHLPGAINLPVEDTFNLKGDHTRIASLQQIRDIMSNAGIRNSDYVVLYDDGVLKDAAHVFWVLETYGQKKISVLNGGFAGWQAHQGEITRHITPRPRSNYLPSIATHRLSTQLSVLLGIRNANVEIIDARVPEEFQGLSSKAKRKGHIPNAINIPWNENIVQSTPVPTLKSKQALRALYGELNKKEKVITYCNRGKESAVTYLVLRNLGYNVSVYDGAWLEWGNDVQLPIVSGTRLSGNMPREQ